MFLGLSQDKNHPPGINYDCNQHMSMRWLMRTALHTIKYQQYEFSSALIFSQE